MRGSECDVGGSGHTSLAHSLGGFGAASAIAILERCAKLFGFASHIWISALINLDGPIGNHDGLFVFVSRMRGSRESLSGCVLIGCDV